MKLYRKIMLICLALIVIFSFSACKKKKIEGTENMTPEEMIENAALRLEDVNNYSSQIKRNVTMQSGDTKVNASELIEITFFKEPLKIKKVQSQDGTIQKDQKKVSYIEEKDGAITTYMNYNNEWLKINETEESAKQTLVSFHPIQNLLSFLREITEVKEDKREEINGKKIIFLTGVLPKEVVPSVLEETQLLQFLGMSNLKPEMYDGIEQLPIMLQIDEATGDVLDYRFDLNSIFEILTNNVLKALGVDEQTTQKKALGCSYEVIFSDYNNAPEIEIPQEAFNASVYTDAQAPAQQ